MNSVFSGFLVHGSGHEENGCLGEQPLLLSVHWTRLKDLGEETGATVNVSPGVSCRIQFLLKLLPPRPLLIDVGGKVSQQERRTEAQGGI